MPKGKLYTQEEVDFIINSLHTLSINQIAEHLHRTPGAILSFKHRMHLMSTKWTPEMDKTLIKMFKNHKAWEIATLLEVKVSSVYNRAYNLGLKKK